MRRGFTVVEALIVLALAALTVLIALPGFLEGRRHANEAAAIHGLKVIITAETQLPELGPRRRRYLSLRGLADAGLVDEELGSGRRQGYAFAAAPSNTTPEYLWWVTARPVTPGLTGDRYFAANQSGVIYYSVGPRPGPVRVPADTCQMPAGAIPACGK